MKSWYQGLRLTILGTLYLFLVLAFGCAGPFFLSAPTPLPHVPAWQLLLDRDPFPPEWSIGPCTLSPRCRGESEAFREFGIVGVPGHVTQDVAAFSNIAGARAGYQSARGRGIFQPQQPPDAQFKPPAEITYRSLVADEFYLGCGVDIVPGCEALYRYGNYFVEFYFSIDGGKGDGLEIHQVVPILRAMDERAMSVWGLKPQPESTRVP